MKYKAVRGIENDKTGKRFEPGEEVLPKDFPKEVLNHWLEKGVIEEVTHGDGEDALKA